MSGDICVRSKGNCHLAVKSGKSKKILRKPHKFGCLLFPYNFFSFDSRMDLHLKVQKNVVAIGTGKKIRLERPV